MSEAGAAAAARYLDFGLLYDGPALANHEMDVRDLAPALLSAGELFHTVNRLIHPSDPDVEIRIRATAEGSFLVVLKVLYDGFNNVTGNPALVGTEGLVGLLGTVVGVIKVRQKRHQAGAPETQDVVRPGFTRLVWSDGTSLEVPSDSLRLADDDAVRRPLANLVKPLAREGVEAISVRRDEETLAEVGEDDLEAFVADIVGDEQIISTNERNVALQILNPAFQVGRKWRFSDGRWPFWAELLDERFNQRIAGGEQFGARDTLTCKLRETQWQDDEGLHSSIVVLEVLDHQIPPEQARLDV